MCRELGYQDGRAARQAEFGTAHLDVPIWMDHVSCDGTEQFLSNCVSDGWGYHNCSHGDDAGVICSGKKTLVL